MRFVLSLLLASTAALVVPSPAQAAAVTTTQDGIRYTADDTKVSAGATVARYTGSGGAVTIPDTIAIGGTTYDVTTIADSAFNNGGVTSVSLGSKLTTIQTGAFLLNRISTLTIPDSVTTIGERAFGFNGLTSLDLGKGVVRLRDRAFAGNELTSVTLPASLVTLDDGAFGSNLLTSITIPDTVTSVGFSTFADNRLTTVSIGSGITEIKGEVFARNQISGVTIPSTITSIGGRAFGQNSTLQNVRFLGAAPTVGADPFGSGTPTVRYRPQFAASGQNPSGFTSPIWQDYPTQAYGIVSFDPNGGTPDPADQLVDVGGKATKPADPVKQGTPFRGWFTSTAATTAYDFDTAVTGDVPLTARYGTEPTISGTAGDARVGDEYTFEANVTGDPTPVVTLSAGELPDGLQLSSSTGKITGTPVDEAREYDATLKATNDYGSDTLDITITLAAGDADTLTLEASDTTPNKSDTITITTTAEDEAGNDLGNWDDNSTLTSDVATDRIDGNRVTFPTASPHTITATDDEDADVQGDIVIQVSASSTSGNGVLPDTGTGLTLWGLALALVLTTAGAALVRRKHLG